MPITPRSGCGQGPERHQPRCRQGPVGRGRPVSSRSPQTPPRLWLQGEGGSTSVLCRGRRGSFPARRNSQPSSEAPGRAAAPHGQAGPGPGSGRAGARRRAALPPAGSRGSVRGRLGARSGGRAHGHAWETPPPRPSTPHPRALPGGSRGAPLSRAPGTGTCLAWLPAQTAHPRSCRPVSASEGPQGSSETEAAGVARGCPTRGLRSCPPRAKVLGQAVAWKGHRPPPAAAEGRSPISPLPRLVVLCCQPWLFVPSPPHLPYNRLTVSGTHSSGHPPTPPLAKNTRPKKLLSHPHLMEDGEETFPMQDRAFSSISLWGWSVSLAPTQATGSCCQLTVLW